MNIVFQLTFGQHQPSRRVSIDLSNNDIGDLRTWNCPTAGLEPCNIYANRFENMNSSYSTDQQERVLIVMKNNSNVCNDSFYNHVKYFERYMCERVATGLDLGAFPDCEALVFPVDNAECPEVCNKCWRKPKESSFGVDCSDRNLGEVPKLVPHKDEAIELDFAGNRLKDLPELTPLGYYNLVKLDASRNRIGKIDVKKLPATLQVTLVVYAGWWRKF